MTAITPLTGVRPDQLALQQSRTNKPAAAFLGSPVNTADRGNSSRVGVFPPSSGRAQAGTAALNAILNQTSAGLGASRAAQDGIVTIARLVAAAQSVVQQAQQANDPAVRADLANQFNSILSQIDQAAQNANFGGTNLLNGGSLAVQISGDIMTVPGVTDTAVGLGIAPATNAWASTSDAATAATSLKAAAATLDAQSTTFAAARSSLQSMTSFMAGAVGTMQYGSTAAASLNVLATADQSATQAPTYS